MSPQLTDELRQQFGQLFVRVDDSVTDEAERTRLYERGTELYEKQFDLIESIAFGTGGKTPKLEVYAGNALPSEKIISFNEDDENPIIRIAVDSPSASETLGNYLALYSQRLDNTTSPKTLAQTTDGKTISDVDKLHGDDANQGMGFYGLGRADYDLVNGPDNTKHHKNTRRDTRIHREMRKNEPEEWKFWLNVLFEISLEKQKPHDWLRSLRVHAGREIIETSRMLGMEPSGSAYSHYENGKNGGGIMPYRHYQKILQKNFFHWPTGDDGMVEDKYAEKFLTKMGYGLEQFDWRTGKLKEGWVDNILKESPEDNQKQAGKLLSAFRMRAGLSQKDIADKIGFVESTIGHWEIGETPINYQKLDDIAVALKLDDNEKEQLISYRPPTTPIDPKWLAEQPEEKQAGLLLKNLRERACFFQRELANEVGTSDAAISSWETGKNKILDKHLPKLVAVFEASKELPDFDAEYFKEIVAKSNDAIREQKKMARTSTQIGATHCVSKHPELSPPEETREQGMSL